MARKKNEETTPKNDYLDAVKKEIEKKYGKGTLVGGEDLFDVPPMIIPLSPSLDIGLGGGVPEGSWVVSSGKPKLGKTTAALSFATNCQKPEYGNREVFYANVECRLAERNLSIDGFDKSKFHVIGPVDSEKDTPWTAQEFLDAISMVLNSVPGCMVIIDSASALCSEQEFNGGIGTETRGGGMKLFTSFVNQMRGVVAKNKSIVWCVTHIIANTSGYGSPNHEKAANALLYQADTRILAKKATPWTVGNKQIGQITTWSMLCAPFNGPGTEVESYLRYGHGIDRAYELMKYGQDLGLIESKGAWTYLTYMLNHPEAWGEGVDEENAESFFKANGGEKAYQLLKSNPKWMEILKEDMISMTKVI